MSDKKKTPYSPVEGFGMGLKLEFHFDELCPSKKFVKLQTEPEDTPEIVAAALAGLQGISPAGAAPQAKAQAPESEKISAYIDPYFDNLPLEQRPKGKTLEQYRASIQTFIKIVGDKPLLQLGRKDANRFEDIIKKMPANSTKLANTRELSVDELVALGLPPMSLTNAKNIARRTNKFLRFAFRREGVDAPFQLLDEVKVAKRAKGENRRQVFTDDDLRLIFNPETLATGQQAKPYMYWVPLIALHSGMRINEIAQLLLSDLTVIDGIECFNVTDEPDPNDEDDKQELARRKSVKTEAGKRVVPIHPKLIELGLLSYAQTLRQAGHTRLFPDLATDNRDGPGQPASKQFGRYLNRLKLTDRRLVFHSFRHGAVEHLRGHTDLPRELRKLVVGHSPYEDTHDGYGNVEKSYSTRQKFDAISRLNFDSAIDYAGLKEPVRFSVWNGVMK
jgi:integrase